MNMDWDAAWRVGGLGFIVVFAVLSILAIVIGIIGKLLARVGAGQTNNMNHRKER